MDGRKRFANYSRRTQNRILRARKYSLHPSRVSILLSIENEEKKIKFLFEEVSNSERHSGRLRCITGGKRKSRHKSFVR